MKNIKQNKPIRLYKKEPILLEYELRTVIITGAVFIALLILMATFLGSDNFNFLLSRSI